MSGKDKDRNSLLLWVCISMTHKNIGNSNFDEWEVERCLFYFHGLVHMSNVAISVIQKLIGKLFYLNSTSLGALKLRCNLVGEDKLSLRCKWDPTTESVPFTEEGAV